ncbi:glycoside hydrolase family 26 protein [Streptacidiphilus sp. N1-12]|uniref:Glycoside hydrolase family 26 protein n=2 Tax=Streptacidiphilus alkalitolerans TaxID=3342712 RepID=A0ABV6V5U3_9ACTN
MTLNALLLCSLSYGVYAAVLSKAQAPGYSGLGAEAKGPGLVDRLKLEAPKTSSIPEKEQLLDPDGIYFGTSTKQSPWSGAEVRQVGTEAGARPTISEYFVNWKHGFDPKAVAAAYQHGTLPLISWEPWAGGDSNQGAGIPKTTSADVNQPAYRLANITAGKFDSYITAFAKGVAADRRPVMIRFAHEMNGSWYPWSEQTNGNHLGDYVKAWQHVHDLFVRAGAVNAIWIWSPDVVRGSHTRGLAALYPGDAYVDLVGLTGYGVLGEKTPDTTFDSTLKKVAALTSKKVLITETGAEPSSLKATWIGNFFPWLIKHPQVIGFVWFEKDIAGGANADWRFSATPETLRAFQQGIKKVHLVTGSAKAAASAASP